MLQNCEGIIGYDGKIPDGTVLSFKEGDILVSNIRPYLKKAWYADRSGGCSPDVLVLRVKNESRASSSFIARIIQQDSFFDYVMQDVKGIKMPRGKKEHILTFRFFLPELQAQNEVMNQVNYLENKIKAAKARLNELSIAKEDVLRKNLV